MSRDGRLYKAEWVTDENGEIIIDTNTRTWVSAGRYELEPAGWAEYAREAWPEKPEHENWPNGYKPFFWPSTDRIFRSRSAAQRRVDIINRWGGRAVLVECTPHWETVGAANARRQRERLNARKSRLIDQIRDIDEQIDAHRADATGGGGAGDSIRDVLDRIESGIESFDSDDDRDKDLSGLLDSSAGVEGVRFFKSRVGNVERMVQVVGDSAHAADLTYGRVHS